MIDLVKTLTGETDEAIINAYLDIAKSTVLNRMYPYGYEDDVEMPKRYQHVQVEIAVFFLNKMGKEGVVSYSENGLSGTYENGDVPTSILCKIMPHGKVFE